MQSLCLECLQCSKKLTKCGNGLELKLLAIITLWLCIHIKGVGDCRAAHGAFYPQLNAPAEHPCYFLKGCVNPLLGVHAVTEWLKIWNIVLMFTSLLQEGSYFCPLCRYFMTEFITFYSQI